MPLILSSPLLFQSVVRRLVRGLQRDILLASLVLHGALASPNGISNQSGRRVVPCQITHLLNLLWGPLLALIARAGTFFVRHSGVSYG